MDPSYDFPEVLNAYARKRNAPRDRWKFLTGSEAQLQELLIKRMRVEMGAPRPIEGTDLIDISHANKFALIDQNGDVRGFWSTDELARGNLINAARMLATRGANP